MESVISLLIVYLICYGLLIASLSVGFNKVKKWESTASAPKTTFSIVIPFRNESANLPALLESIRNLNYPNALFELIMIDDESNDDSQKIVYKWRMENGAFHTTLIENVRRSNSPKKDAINRAVPIVVNQWIVTTDADCVVPKNWLTNLNDYILQNDVSMIAGSVVYKTKNSFLHHFQQMDLMSLQGATIGAFGLGKGFMCNGGNFAYKKSLFQSLNGFQGNDGMASGDDVFLLQKAILKMPEQVHYLKSRESIVVTKPAGSWQDLFFQRVRWASKATTYDNNFGELVALVVFLANVSLLLLLAFAISGHFDWRNLTLLFAGKFVVDFILLLQTNAYLRKGKFLFPIFSSAFYPFFSVAVALYCIYGKYEWKGRKLK